MEQKAGLSLIEQQKMYREQQKRASTGTVKPMPDNYEPQVQNQQIIASQTDEQLELDPKKREEIYRQQAEGLVPDETTEEKLKKIEQARKAALTLDRGIKKED